MVKYYSPDQYTDLCDIADRVDICPECGTEIVTVKEIDDYDVESRWRECPNCGYQPEGK